MAQPLTHHMPIAVDPFEQRVHRFKVNQRLIDVEYKHPGLFGVPLILWVDPSGVVIFSLLGLVVIGLMLLSFSCFHTCIGDFFE